MTATLEPPSLDPPSAAGGPPRPGGRPWRREALAAAGVLLAWLALVLLARAWALRLVARNGVDSLRLGAAPLVGRGDFHVGAGTLVAVGVGLGVVAAAPLLGRLRWRWLLLVVLALAVVWPVALNVTRGPEGLTAPLIRENDEYLPDVAAVGSPGAFLRGYPDHIDDYNVHVRSHPPGFLLLLWSMDEVGLGGAGWAAVLCILGGAVAAPAVLIATRDVAGEGVARRAAPFVALSPAALWVATSADAFYAGVGAVGLAALMVATGRPGRRGDAWALLAGVALGACLLFSYGLALLWLVALPVAVHRRRVRPVLLAATAATAVLGLSALAGLDYLAAFSATRREVAESVQRTRPYTFSLVSNLAALAIAGGPATVAGLVWLRDRDLWRVVSGALLAVVLAGLIGLSKGEVERIWLPFTVWLLAAGAAVVARQGPRSLRPWLGAQVLVAIVVQTIARTGW